MSHDMSEQSSISWNTGMWKKSQTTTWDVLEIRRKE